MCSLVDYFIDLGPKYVFHGGIGLLDELRDGGQTHHTAPDVHHLYQIGLETHRYEAYMKHAFILDAERGTNIALMASGSLHKLDASYGNKAYDVDEKNGYLQLMYETNRHYVRFKGFPCEGFPKTINKGSVFGPKSPIKLSTGAC